MTVAHADDGPSTSGRIAAGGAHALGSQSARGAPPAGSPMLSWGVQAFGKPAGSHLALRPSLSQTAPPHSHTGTATTPPSHSEPRSGALTSRSGTRPGSCPQTHISGRSSSPMHSTPYTSPYSTPFVPTNYAGFVSAAGGTYTPRHAGVQDASKSHRPMTAPSSPLSHSLLGGRSGSAARPGSQPTYAYGSAATTPRSTGPRSTSPPTQLPPWRNPSLVATPTYAPTPSGRDEVMRPASVPFLDLGVVGANGGGGGIGGGDQQVAREKARALHFWQTHMEDKGLLDLYQLPRRDDGSLMGVSLEFLVAMAESLELHQGLPDSTEGVVQELILPIVRPQQCRLIDMVPLQHLGRPQYFVSHAWKADFSDLVKTIQAELSEPSSGDAAGLATGRSTFGASSSSASSPRRDDGGAHTDRSHRHRHRHHGCDSDDGAPENLNYRHSTSGPALSARGPLRAHFPGSEPPRGRSASSGGSVQAPLEESASSEEEEGDAPGASSSRPPEGVQPMQMARGAAAFVWIDILCCPQHAGPLGARKDLAKLRHIMNDCACTLVVIDSAAVALTRSWCLYEVYLSQNQRILLKVLPVPQLAPEVLLRAVRALDASKATATRVKDREALTTELITGGWGLQEVNRLIKETLVRTNAEREYELSLLRIKTAAAMLALRRLEEPIPHQIMHRARVLLQEVLELGYPRELARLLSNMPPASSGDADFCTVQRLGLLADMLERQYKIGDAKEVRRISARLFRSYSHRFVAARFENEITQAVVAEITSRKGYRKLVARIGKGVSPDLYNGG